MCCQFARIPFAGEAVQSIVRKPRVSYWPRVERTSALLPSGYVKQKRLCRQRLVSTQRPGTGVILSTHALGCDGSSKLSGPLFRHHQRPVRRNHESNVTRFHDSATRSINSGTWRPAARSAVLCSQGRCKANARRAASVQLWLDIVPHIVVIVLMPMVRGKPGNS